jgi:mRNA-degrading endonuclease RelE of RelBE toxin-antitoxin system
MGHSVEFKPSADKAIDALPREYRARIIKASLALADNPRPQGSKKLKPKIPVKIIPTLKMLKL